MGEEKEMVINQMKNLWIVWTVKWEIIKKTKICLINAERKKNYINLQIYSMCIIYIYIYIYSLFDVLYSYIIIQLTSSISLTKFI